MSMKTKVDVTRYTFLRGHVQALIHEPVERRSNQRWPADEILSLGTIRQQARQDAAMAGQPLDEAAVLREASPQSFFHGLREQQGLPDQPVVPHFPVKVISLDPEKRKGANSLTELLDRPRIDPEPPEICCGPVREPGRRSPVGKRSLIASCRHQVASHHRHRCSGERPRAG